MRFAGHVARIEGKKNAYRLLMGEPERKRPLESPIRGWMDNIKMDLGEIEWGGVEWIGLESSCECRNEPSGSIKFWEVLEFSIT
jgi:hypothetical protein